MTFYTISLFYSTKMNIFFGTVPSNKISHGILDESKTRRVFIDQWDVEK